VVGEGGWLIAVVLGPARPLIGGECLQGAGVRLHVGVSDQCPLGGEPYYKKKECSLLTSGMQPLT
jgi:hypothetical protein